MQSSLKEASVTNDAFIIVASVCNFNCVCVCLCVFARAHVRAWTSGLEKQCHFDGFLHFFRALYESMGKLAGSSNKGQCVCAWSQDPPKELDTCRRGRLIDKCVSVSLCASLKSARPQSFCPMSHYVFVFRTSINRCQRVAQSQPVSSVHGLSVSSLFEFRCFIHTLVKFMHV